MAPVIIERTTQTKPSHATHWSVRTLADTLGIDKSMVQRVWHASGLKPHLSKTFKVSRDKKFVEKVIDVVGLYLNPPEHALVLCADEKTSVQALDRTQPGLPTASAPTARATLTNPLTKGLATRINTPRPAYGSPKRGHPPEFHR
jgi:hypothetical protein